MRDHPIEECTPKCFHGQPVIAVPAKPSKIGYMCAVDWQWHIEGSHKGANVYPSLGQLKALRPCSEECGVVRVKVVLDRVVHGEVWDFIRRKRKNERNGRRRKPLMFK